jgi:hypothetical protein
VAAVLLVVVSTGLSGAPVAAGQIDAGPVTTLVSAVQASDGSRHTITNHLTPLARQSGERTGPRREYLLVWAGDEEANSASTPDPDFLAVIDATRGPRYGKVINTVTIDSIFGNEPHHMQYAWHKGQRVYAGGMFSDTTYIFDVSRLPVVTLSGVKIAADTPCGSVPDAYQVLKDGTAYGTYMGGPDVAGACTYTDGAVRIGNGFAGSPGEIVHLGPDGKVLAEAPASSTEPERATCQNLPALPTPTCANPHGIAVREDLNRMVTSDLAEISHTINQVPPPDLINSRDTVRVFDISRRNDPKLLSVSYLPEGPRPAPEWWLNEHWAAMETAVTNQPRHRGAFSATMGGAVYYTPDITVRHPQWREVFDDATGFASMYPGAGVTSLPDGGAWLQVSPDDRYLYHVATAGGPEGKGMLFVLDIRRLLASGSRTTCSIDAAPEMTAGGSEPECPKLVSAAPIGGGPHWGAYDNFRPGPDGRYRETTDIGRIVTTNYFVAATGFDGDHRVCMFDLDSHGTLSLDEAFRDEYNGQPCIDFNRTSWPHGNTGHARPHGLLFTVADADLR